jgi:hypothetical protein
MPYVSDEAGEIRASDGERDEVAARLSKAVGRGELTLAEFSGRVESAYAARTRGELDNLTTDLRPAASADPATTTATAPAPAGAPAARPKPNWAVTLIGGISRKGRWRVPERTISVSIIGGADLNMRDAELSAPEVEITKWALIGGISVVVPRGVRVQVDGVSILGGKDVKIDEGSIHTGAPLVRIKIFCLIGGVSVRNPSGSELSGG